MDLEAILKHDDKFKYMLLDRMRTDCDYYLGNGNRNEKHLWAKNASDQIDYMKIIWNEFAFDKKPEWLSYEKILEYEKQIVK